LIPRGIRIVQAAIVVAAAGIVAVSIWWTRPSRTASPVPSPAPTAAEVNGSLLQQIDGARPPGEVDLSGPVPTNEQLEKQFSLILQNQERVNELKTQAARSAAAKTAAAHVAHLPIQTDAKAWW
jgi:hypothetical protein